MFFPAATHLDAQDNVAGLRRMYLAGLKVLVLLGVMCGMMAIWASEFFTLWVGDPFLIKSKVRLTGVYFTS